MFTINLSYRIPSDFEDYPKYVILPCVPRQGEQIFVEDHLDPLIIQSVYYTVYAPDEQQCIWARVETRRSLERLHNIVYVG